MARPHGGARLMIGFLGTTIDEGLKETLLKTEARSVILFARNLIDAQQARELTQSIRALVPWPLVIAIDQEGGNVVRLEQGVTVFPGNMAVGETHDPGFAQAVGKVTAMEMAACGIDLILAPVVDIHVHENNPIVGFRSFGRDRQLVGAMATALISGFNAGGCSACLKHFPGLGPSNIDPHIELPTINGTLAEIFDPHMSVFGDIIDNQFTPPAVMTTHVVLPDLDQKNMATVSPAIVKGILRQKLNFDGCIITDDLEMGGATPLGSIEEAVVGAALAGHDLMAICHQHDLQMRAAQALEAALESGVLEEADHVRSCDRIHQLKRRSGELPPMLNPQLGAGLASSIARRVVRLIRDPQSWNEDLPYSNWKVEGGVATQREQLAALLESEEETCGRAHLVDNPSQDESQRKAIRVAWETNQNDVLFVLLRSPSDLKFIPVEAPVLSAFGRTNSQFEAIAKKLQSQTRKQA